ncbi:hypothetical protein CBM2613_B50325 [Cupriavidus taiwanensis]|uniref:Uncharacterized protein n=1 Tax=Cupriavidus taiwanensis TaxID=164546 RepID=A0A375EAV9_9BURK|nr:hypothetical protein CBM2613_B50325 [Cupriavidus taiwanensis]
MPGLRNTALQEISINCGGMANRETPIRLLAH